jgi:Uma2 family endonuclease
MMVAETALPLTNLALAGLVDSYGFYRVPATPDEYWTLLADAEYRVDYYDHHIIASMSYESDIHSRIASELNYLLRTIFTDKSRYLVYNSNRPVYVGTDLVTGTGVFNADGMVVSLPRNPHTYQPGLSAETTPVLLIEVLSPSTRAYDLATKLPAYKNIPSVTMILYVEQDRPDVLVMERQAPNRWTETRLTALAESFVVAGSPVTLGQVYQGIYS